MFVQVVVIDAEHANNGAHSLFDIKPSCLWRGKQELSRKHIGLCLSSLARPVSLNALETQFGSFLGRIDIELSARAAVGSGIIEPVVSKLMRLVEGSQFSANRHVVKMLCTAGTRTASPPCNSGSAAGTGWR
jgi:hypothetical protein